MNPSGYRIDEEKKLDAPTTPNSYKSTHSSRSSVLERAREYNRRVEQKDVDRQRSRSLDQRSRHLQQPQQQHSTTNNNHNHDSTATSASNSAASSSYAHPDNSSGRRSQSAGRAGRPQHHHVKQAASRERAMASVRHDTAATKGAYTNNNYNNTSTSKSKSSMTSPQPQQPPKMSQPDPQQQQDNPVVTPELLVDALSGHEDGLLAIAEKLMEHYDQGYDVMGEAIIDAFADVQKLFQHVVEAAHMEGAAFEASRRDEELQELRNQVEQLQGGLMIDSQNQNGNPYLYQSNSPLPSPSNNKDGNNNNNSTPSGPQRHDEFIDQDVQDALTDAIRQGTALAQTNPQQCYQIYEKACQDASSLLPVDSDHRGRLQLSLARAESLSAERACAILRYAMDDVLRSGRRALHAHTPLPDISQRADVVLQRNTSAHHSHLSVVQSSDEALASLMEEMKEIISAPIYNDTPLQNVAQRFWAALQEAQKVQHKNAERLEQNLGKLKGEFLLARAVCSNDDLLKGIAVCQQISILTYSLHSFIRNGKKN